MKFTLLFALSATFNTAAQAAPGRIYCAFQEDLKSSDHTVSGYVTHYDVAGTVNADGTISVGQKRFEYGVSNIGGQWKIDYAKKGETLVDYRARKFVRSPKNNNPEWTTFVPKNGYSDGNITHISLTISNKNLAADTPQYQATYRAIYQYTLLGDDSNYVSKTYGTCSYTK